MWEDLLRSITSLVLCLCVCLSFVQLLINLLLQERPSLHKEPPPSAGHGAGLLSKQPSSHPLQLSGNRRMQYNAIHSVGRNTDQCMQNSRRPTSPNFWIASTVRAVEVTLGFGPKGPPPPPDPCPKMRLNIVWALDGPLLSCKLLTANTQRGSSAHLPRRHIAPWAAVVHIITKPQHSQVSCPICTGFRPWGGHPEGAIGGGRELLRGLW